MKNQPLICALTVLISSVFCPLGINAQNGNPPFDPQTLVAAPKGSPSDPAWGFWSKTPPEAWQQTHWGFVNKAKQNPVEVLFLGDSITKGWAEGGKEIWQQNYQPLKALNIGIGGDTTRQTLWRLDHEAFGGNQPKVVVLMIGVNNIFTATGTDEEIVAGITEILKKIQSLSPSSKILLLSVLPLGNEGQNARIKHINSLLTGLAKGNVRVLDLTSDFVTAEGTINPELYSKDSVHLAKPGYVAWDKTMHPILVEMLK